MENIYEEQCSLVWLKPKFGKKKKKRVVGTVHWVGVLNKYRLGPF